jgi:hypothetical protein
MYVCVCMYACVNVRVCVCVPLCDVWWIMIAKRAGISKKSDEAHSHAHTYTLSHTQVAWVQSQELVCYAHARGARAILASGPIILTEDASLRTQWVSICMYVYVNVCIYVYIYIYIYKHMRTYTQTYIQK